LVGLRPTLRKRFGTVAEFFAQGGAVEAEDVGGAGAIVTRLFEHKLE
jgi:hypothetical protein